jgi:hypothetical protein
MESCCYFVVEEKYLQLEGKVKAVGKTVHECFIT